MWASMCAAEIVHYRVDQVIKKTRNGLKEQAHLVLHHDRTINQMLAWLEKLEGKWSEINQYQKFLEVVQAWDGRIDALEQAHMQSVQEAGQVALTYQMEISTLEAHFQAGLAESWMLSSQLQERTSVLENSLLASEHRIGVLKTQVSLFLTLSC